MSLKKYESVFRKGKKLAEARVVSLRKIGDTGLFLNYNQGNESMEQIAKDISRQLKKQGWSPDEVTGLVTDEDGQVYVTSDNEPWHLSASYEAIRDTYWG